MLKICTRCMCHYRETQLECPHCRGEKEGGAGLVSPASLHEGLERAGGKWGTAGTLVLLAAMMGTANVSCGVPDTSDGTPVSSPSMTGTPAESPTPVPEVTGTGTPYPATPTPSTTGTPAVTPTP